MSSEDLKRQLAEAQERARQATNTRVEKGNDWAQANRERENTENALANVGENIEEKESRLAQMLELEVKNALFQESARVELLEMKFKGLELKLESKKDYDDSTILAKLEELEGKLEEKDKEINQLKERLDKNESKNFFQRLFGR